MRTLIGKQPSKSRGGLYKAKDDYRQQFVEELEMEEAKGNLFGVVKRMASRNKDVVEGGGVKDKEGKVQAENSRMLEVWREYYEKLLNEEFMWRRDGLETLAPTEGPCEQLTWEEVRNARTRSIWRRMVRQKKV